ncbi:MAG: hypothetical protein ACREDE_00070 [Thermoplasmata archaeon]
MRLTPLPPAAQILEMLGDPMAGSKVIGYYTSKGDRTSITVIADFMSPMLPAHLLERAAGERLDNTSTEDATYLKKMR